MNDPDHERYVLLTLALLLLGVGVAVGAWNEWVTQACLAQERPPGTYVDCVDGLTIVLRYGSIVLALAGVGLLVAVRRRG